MVRHNAKPAHDEPEENEDGGRVIGWNPVTGEPIVEKPEKD